MYGNLFMLLLETSVLSTTQFPFPVIEEPILLPIQIEPPCICLPTRPVRVSEKREVQDLILRWNEVALQAIKAERTPPPLAARNLAIVHIAMYDAMNTLRTTHPPFVIRASGPRGVSTDVAVAVAAHRSLLTLYPKQLSHLNAALDASLESIPDGAAKIEGADWGRRVAETVLDWRSKDLVISKSNYAPRDEVGRWKPTPANFRPPLLPGWSRVSTFAVQKLDRFRPAGPPSLTSEEFITAFHEVKKLGSRNSRDRTEEQSIIARFWADGEGTVTPPGHWNRIAATVSRERRLSTSENARLFAMLNVAMADTSIACWDCKYRFDFWRPLTAIREASRLEDSRLVAERDWTPLLETPPFPAYTSGHSSFSGAAAMVLKEFFGTDDVRFTTTSEGLPGVKRSFTRFSDAAMEAGMSRIYGGIHWSFDNTHGLETGGKIGQAVVRAFR